jgi:hypothetical protein
MRKEKKEKKEIPPLFFATTEHHRRNNCKKKNTPYPSQYHLIKLLYFSSSLEPPHLKTNPLRDGKSFKYLNPDTLLTQLF